MVLEKTENDLKVEEAITAYLRGYKDRKSILAYIPSEHQDIFASLTQQPEFHSYVTIFDNYGNTYYITNTIPLAKHEELKNKINSIYPDTVQETLVLPKLEDVGIILIKTYDVIQTLTHKLFQQLFLENCFLDFIKVKVYS